MAPALSITNLAFLLASCACALALIALLRSAPPALAPHASTHSEPAPSALAAPPALGVRAPGEGEPSPIIAPAARERIEGMGGPIAWIDLLAVPGLGAWSTTMPACWRRDGGYVEGARPDGDGSVLLIGDGRWRDYECALRVMVQAGGEAEVRLRARDPGHGYCVALLAGMQAISVRLLGAGSPPRLLSCVDAEIRPGRTYDLRLAVRGESITTYLDGHLANQLTDATYPSGGCGLGVWQSRARFAAPRVRFLDGCDWAPHVADPPASQAGF